jgi:hypothetical protein
MRWQLDFLRMLKHHVSSWVISVGLRRMIHVHIFCFLSAAQSLDRPNSFGPDEEEDEEDEEDEDEDAGQDNHYDNIHSGI